MAGRHLPRVGNFPGRTSFKGAVRMGKDSGIPDNITIGEAVFTQRADLSAAETSATTVFVLPSDHEGGIIRSDVIDIRVVVSKVFEDSAQPIVQFHLGSAAGTNIGEVRVSALGVYTATVATTAGLDARFGIVGQPILAKVSATGTQADTGQAYVICQYVPR